MNHRLDRRRFLSQSTLAAAAGIAAPAILTSKRTAAQEVITSGEFSYRFDHHPVTLPQPFFWQITHNVAVDPDDNLYVIHEGNAKLADHPAIFVFDPQGKLIRSFGKQFQGGGHGLEVHVEDGAPYLYVSGYQMTKTICKMTLTGELIWQQYAPVQAGVYAAGEASNPAGVWGQNRFMPTNFAFLQDEFLVADGYGSFLVHRYDFDGNWKSSFGGPGNDKGKFNTPHGIWIDRRDGDEPSIVVCDRANNRLQTFSADGEHRKTVDGFGLPANADTYQQWMIIPELVAQVSILDKDHKVVAKLGSDQDRILADKEKNKGFVIRTDESKWQNGKFIHPHDACFDSAGNIFVAEWVSTGRITKLTRV